MMFQDFLPRLKDHLVHHMKATLAQESTSVETQSNPSYGEEHQQWRPLGQQLGVFKKQANLPS